MAPIRLDFVEGKGRRDVPDPQDAETIPQGGIKASTRLQRTEEDTFDPPVMQNLQILVQLGFLRENRVRLNFET